MIVNDLLGVRRVRAYIGAFKPVATPSFLGHGLDDQLESLSGDTKHLALTSVLEATHVLCFVVAVPCAEVLP